METIITMVVSGLALILSTITVIFSIMAYCKVIGLEKSTHQIQYMPVPHESVPDSTEEQDEDLSTLNGGVDKDLMKGMREHMYRDINNEYT